MWVFLVLLTGIYGLLPSGRPDTLQYNRLFPGEEPFVYDLSAVSNITVLHSIAVHARVCADNG